MRALVIALALSFIAPAAFAETFFIRPVASSSLPENEQQAVAELVKIAVNGVDGASITEDESKADAVLAPKVVKLGSAYILSISKIKNGQVVNQQQAKAASLEDMDTVAGRVARATITETAVAKDRRVGDVTEDEVTRGKRRIETVNQRFFGFGPARVQNMGTDEIGVYLNLGHSWGINDHFSLTLGGELAFVRKSFLGNFSLGGEIFLTDRDISPFGIVALGYAVANPNEESAFYVSADKKDGFSAALGAGVRFFRTSRVNFGLSGRYVHVFAKNSMGSPGGVLGAVTLYY